jgi:hypothetical protein
MRCVSEMRGFENGQKDKTFFNVADAPQGAAMSV